MVEGSVQAGLNTLVHLADLYINCNPTAPLTSDSLSAGVLWCVHRTHGHHCFSLGFHALQCSSRYTHMYNDTLVC